MNHEILLELVQENSFHRMGDDSPAGNGQESA